MLDKLTKLKEQLYEVADLNNASALLSWDQQTHMPPGGKKGRGQQLATLERLAHEKFTNAAVGTLLKDLEPYGNTLPYDSDDASYIRVTYRDYLKQVKIPPSLVAEISEAGTAGFHAWLAAKRANRYSDFAPFLQKNVELRRRVAECLGYADRIYDPLLDQFEPGMTTRQVEEIFAEAKREIVPLAHAIFGKMDQVDDSFLHQPFEEQAQWDLTLEVAKAIGFSFERGRQDQSAHPFTTNFGFDDVRITTRIEPNFFNPAFFATIHECGHALYEQGIRHELDRTPLGGAASLGVHESQSRLWENLVGRSRAFWTSFLPRAKTQLSPQFDKVDVERMYRAVNRVEPSFIRVEADEVTYNLHIMLRFELEIALIEGRVLVRDLPEVWNAKMKEYLGVTPPTDALGVMQDVHWSYGTFGYFPTYSLGTFFSVQLFDRAKLDVPDLEERLGRGDFQVLLTWLRDNLYTHGRKFTLDELAQKITGETLQTRSFVTYLRKKYSEIYGLGV